MGICKKQRKDCPCNRCKLGWWSRRHETREAQDAAREEYQFNHGRKARQRKAQERLDAKAA